MNRARTDHRTFCMLASNVTDALHRDHFDHHGDVEMDDMVREGSSFVSAHLFQDWEGGERRLWTASVQRPLFGDRDRLSSLLRLTVKDADGEELFDMKTVRTIEVDDSVAWYGMVKDLLRWLYIVEPRFVVSGDSLSALLHRPRTISR